MKCNIGKTDRSLRMLVGLALIAYGLATGSLLGLVGFVPLITGYIRWCPVYVPLKISTDKQ
jgi:hypothetical protein